MTTMEQQPSVPAATAGNSVRLARPGRPSSRPSASKSQGAIQINSSLFLPAFECSVKEARHKTSSISLPDAWLSRQTRSANASVSNAYLPRTVFDPSEHTLRHSRSAVLQASTQQPEAADEDEPLPSESIMSLVVTDPTPVPQSSTEEMLLEARGRLPEFRQSKRWAKFHDTHRTKADPEKAKDRKTTPSMREASFEQQRARRKPSPESPPPPLPTASIKALSETGSLVQAQGLCRSVSVPTWQLMRSTSLQRPHSLPLRWVARKMSLRRHLRNMSKHSGRKASVDRSKSPVKRHLRPKEAIADLRRKAGLASSGSRPKFAKLYSDKPQARSSESITIHLTPDTMRADAENVVDLDGISALPLPIKQAASPSRVPSLHDPEKAKKFTEECQALLSNIDFDKNWHPASQRSLAPSGMVMQPRQTQTAPRASMHMSRTKPSSPVVNTLSMPGDGPGPALEIRRWNEKKRSAGAPEPPVRTSSKRGAKMASIVGMTRPACVALLNSLRDGMLMGGGESGDVSSTASRANQSTPQNTPSRMSSKVSGHTLPRKGPRPMPSTDTLAMIEAQIQDGGLDFQAIAEKLKQRTAFIVGPQSRSSVECGIPPERPLPALPREDSNLRKSILADRKSQLLQQRAEPQHARLFQSTGEPPPGQLDRPRNGLSKKLKAVASGKGLIVDPGRTIALDAEAGSALRTPSSVRSSTSLDSRPALRLALPFARHDISRLRPERMRDLKKRLKDDLARDRRISEEGDVKVGLGKITDRPLPPLPTAEQMGLDEAIKRFPSVPTSRPQSRASLGARKERQNLGTSEIKVLVDTNPVTGHFRAGALSPSPSQGVNSREGSPLKPRLGFSYANVNMQGNVRDSERSKRAPVHHLSVSSQASSRFWGPKTLSRGSGDPFSDSDDDFSHLFSPASTRDAGEKRTRRRWNSTDLQTVQQLYEDLKDSYDTIMKQHGELRKQKAELRKQRHHIQMMVRLLAPISKANGLKAAMFPALIPKFARETGRAEAAGILEKELQSLKAARARKTKEHETNISGLLRPISHNSTTSGTTNVSIASKSECGYRPSPDGSMTDPLEYEIPFPNKGGAVAKSMSAPVGQAVKGRSKLSARDNETTRPGTAGSKSSMSTLTMHKPPPVARMVPKGTPVEEESMFFGEEFFGDQLDESEELEDEKENLCTGVRLSVNHVLTSTDQMDRALDAMNLA